MKGPLVVFGLILFASQVSNAAELVARVGNPAAPGQHENDQPGAAEDD